MSLVEQALSYVRAISPYQPGKPITELAREMGIPVEQNSQAGFQRESAGHEPEGEACGRGGDQRHRALSGSVRADQGGRRTLRRGAEPGRPRQWFQRCPRPDRPRFPGAGPLGGFRAARLRGLPARHAVNRRRTDRDAGEELRPRPERHARRHPAGYAHRLDRQPEQPDRQLPAVSGGARLPRSGAAGCGRRARRGLQRIPAAVRAGRYGGLDRGFPQSGRHPHLLQDFRPGRPARRLCAGLRRKSPT